MSPILRYSPYGYVNSTPVLRGGGFDGPAGSVIGPSLGTSRIVAEWIPDDMVGGGAGVAVWPDLYGTYDMDLIVGTVSVLGGGPGGNNYIHYTSGANGYKGWFPTSGSPSFPQIPQQTNFIIVVKNVTTTLTTFVRGMGSYGNDWLRTISSAGGHKVGISDGSESASFFTAPNLSSLGWSAIVAHYDSSGYGYCTEHQGATHTLSTATAVAKIPEWSSGVQVVPAWSATCDFAYMALVDGEITSGDLSAMSADFDAKFGIPLV